jgi:hypothetical protein
VVELNLTPHARINFNLRPAKRMERKLIAEALSSIYRYDTPRRFGYVGMGSYYFTDFVLFHRIFGLERMFSIEIDEEHKSRFEFNKPFDCIEMAWGPTTEQLPKLSVFDERPVICWLDYYASLTDSIIGDMQTVLRRALPGSALLLTLNSKSPDTVAKLNAFKASLSEGFRKLSTEALLGKGAKGMAEFMTEVLVASMEPTVADLNSGREAAEKIELRQIVKMFYKDGDPMITIGWFILTPAQATKLDAPPSALDAPGIVISGKDMTEVTAPVLTFREIAHLKSILPNSAAAPDFETRAGSVPVDDARIFAKLYRYFPSFADVEE